MEEADRAHAQAQVARAMLQGHSWRDAVHAVGIQMSRATAYRLRQRLLARGDDALRDRRQGQPTKVCGAVRAWLEGYYQDHPTATGKTVQALLEEQYGVRVSVTHLNRLRATLTGATRRGGKSARSVAGWGRWSPVAGGSRSVHIALDAGGGPADESKSRHASAARASHRQNAAAVSADAAVSGGRRTAPPVGFTRLCPGGVSAPHHPASGVWLSHRGALSLAGGPGGRR